MQIDPRACYRAIEGRDRRFDGRFYTGVLSTGIFCRPICPARTPRPDRVRFFPSPAAAAAAGFRPCLRCRPEAAPGTPAEAGTGATVARALRLIAEGALDRLTTTTFAERLGVGERHLRRLFVEHIGAPPVAVAQTHRLLSAKRLLDATSLPVRSIAAQSGFGSVRRLNFAFRRAYGTSPIERRRGDRGRRGQGARPVELHLAYRPPYAFADLLEFLRFRQVAGVEWAEDGQYARTLRVGTATGTIQVRPDRDGAGLILAVSPPLADSLLEVVRRVRRLFDLDADPAVISGHLADDARLAAIVRERPGLRVPGTVDPFELAVRAVLGQRVSVAAARASARRLVLRCGEPLPAAGPCGLTHLFPSAEQVLAAPLDQLGLLPTQVNGIRAIAQAVASDASFLHGAGDLERTRERLARMSGIGPWTIAYIAMRGLGDPDSFPPRDLVLERALAALAPGTSSERIVQHWRPWRSYAALHLWAHRAAPTHRARTEATGS